MIDLSKKGLPDSIIVSGSFVEIKTDFRFWLNFSEKMSEEEISIQDILECIRFPIDFESCTNHIDETMEQIKQFMAPKEVTPVEHNVTDTTKVIDFIKDGSYIYASFMSCYHIDLVDIEYLHWHKFLALFNSLPDNCMIKNIIYMRSYKKDTRSEESIRKELKRIWSFPKEIKRSEEMQEINDLFYNS